MVRGEETAVIGLHTPQPHVVSLMKQLGYVKLLKRSFSAFPIFRQASDYHMMHHLMVATLEIEGPPYLPILQTRSLDLPKDQEPRKAVSKHFQEYTQLELGSPVVLSNCGVKVQRRQDHVVVITPRSRLEWGLHLFSIQLGRGKAALRGKL
jgi:hypothetical protein